MNLQTLTVEDVLSIHETLVRDFAATGEPIDPPGVRSVALLESAVGRQHVSLGTVLKYPGAVDNAATVTFGICCDHPFHNGNKRTALVALLIHLDKNKLSLRSTSQNQMYSMILDVATHTLGKRTDSRQSRRDKTKQLGRSTDEEVSAISRWLRQRCSPVVRGERPVTFGHLRSILQIHGFTLKHPKGNSIDIVRQTSVRGVLGRTKTEEKHIGNIPFPRENAEVPVRTVKYVRHLCRLREEDGIDSEAFYGSDTPIDAFVNKYRTLLRRLSRK